MGCRQRVRDLRRDLEKLPGAALGEFCKRQPNGGLRVYDRHKRGLWKRTPAKQVT